MQLLLVAVVVGYSKRVVVKTATLVKLPVRIGRVRLVLGGLELEVWWIGVWWIGMDAGLRFDGLISEQTRLISETWGVFGNEWGMTTGNDERKQFFQNTANQAETRAELKFVLFFYLRSFKSISLLPNQSWIFPRHGPHRARVLQPNFEIKL